MNQHLFIIFLSYNIPPTLNYLIQAIPIILKLNCILFFGMFLNYFIFKSERISDFQSTFLFQG